MVTSAERFDVLEGDKKADKAPRQGPQATPSTETPKRRRGRPRGGRAAADTRKIKQAINGIIGTVGIAVYAVDQYDGQVILDRGSALADALTNLAKTRPQIAAIILSASAAGDWAGVLFASMNIAIPIMAHHKLLPEGIASLVSQMEEPQEAPGEEKGSEEVEQPSAAS